MDTLRRPQKLQKGDRLLDMDGVWRCKYGHNKDEVGTYGNARCRQCAVEYMVRRREQINNGTVQVRVIKQRCPSGHDRSVTADKYGHCTACDNAYKRRARRDRIENSPPRYVAISNLRSVRRSLNLSQRALADLVGVSSTCISDLELQTKRASYDTYQKIMQTLAPIIAAQKRHGYR